MRICRISISSIAIILVCIMILPSIGSAVNSFCVTSRLSSPGHAWMMWGINRANDELNDYYTSQGQMHLKYNIGCSKAGTLMLIQQYQPQHYIFFGHGNADAKGRCLEVGVGSSKEWLYAANFISYIKTANKEGFSYAALPLSTVIFMSCWSARGTPDTTDFSEVFGQNNDMGAWLYVGLKDSLRGIDGYNFLKNYADKVTDGKRSYQRAIEQAIPTSRAGLFNCKYWTNKAGSYGLDHNTREDKYRNIDRKESSEGTTLYKGNSKTLIYYRNFQGTTNGAYVVFHGLVNTNWGDVTNDANIRIKVKRWTGSQYQEIRNNLYENVKNQKVTINGITTYGGSDICCRRISSSHMSLTGTSHLKVDVIFESGSANNIYIDRFELMEIGK